MKGSTASQYVCVRILEYWYFFRMNFRFINLCIYCRYYCVISALFEVCCWASKKLLLYAKSVAHYDFFKLRDDTYTTTITQ